MGLKCKYTTWRTVYS